MSRFPLTFLLLAATALAQDPTPPSAEAAVRARLQAHLTQHGASGVCAAYTSEPGTRVAIALGVDAAGVVLTDQSQLMSGSIGKTYVAAVALQLVAEGKLALDGKVADVLGKEAWYARLPNADSVTLRQLLNHTSGIPEHVWKPEFQTAVKQASDRALGAVECIGFILGDKAVAPAGERWSYADTNYLIAGLCIERAAGKPYDAVLRARILEPLRLGATQPNGRRAVPGLACGMASGIGFHEGPVVDKGLYFTNPAFEGCGGGLRSTALDLAVWMRELSVGDVVPASLRKDHRTGVPVRPGAADRYGLGCFLSAPPHGEALGHSGVMPGYLSQAMAYPDLRVTVAVMFPTDAMQKVGNLKQLCDQIAGDVAGGKGAGAAAEPVKK